MEHFMEKLLRDEFIILFHSLWRKDASTSYYVNLFDESKVARHFRQFSANKAEGKSNVIANKRRADGNQLFGEKKWLEALNKYNESLCYAEFGSESVGLAYANRASCYSHLGEYDSCLADIELAIKSKYPERLMPKLQQKKADCMAKQHQRHVFKPKLELSYPANASIPCIANVLEIQQNAKFGRHVVAKCAIPAGKTVCIEPSFVSSTNNNRSGAYCSACQRLMPNLMPCESCTVTMFCSVDCVERSRIYHANECGYTPCIDKHGQTLQHLIRSIIIAIHACGGVDELMAFVESVRGKPAGIPTSVIDPLDQYRLFLQLNICEKNRDGDNAAQAYCYITTWSEMTHSFNTLKKRRFLMHLLVMHEMIIRNNCYGGNDGDLTMSLMASLFNHQCTPNIVCSIIDRKWVAFTVRPIDKGQQLFLSYASYDQSNRRQYIYDGYGFWCDCSKCVPAVLPSQVIRSMENDEDFVALRLINLTIKDAVTQSDTKEHCIRLFNKYGHLPYTTAFENVLRIFEAWVWFTYHI